MCSRSSVTISLSFPKLGVPTPVTGSQPFVAYTARQDVYVSHRIATKPRQDTTHIEARSTAAGVVADGDVVERGRFKCLDRVDERVQEAERWETLGEARRVEQGDDAGERRCRSGGTADRDGHAGEENAEEVSLGSHIGDRLMTSITSMNKSCVER